MPNKTVYTNLTELTALEGKIMRFISDWVHKEKTVVPLKEIMAKMVEEGAKAPTVTWSVGQLLLKGFIRRACIISNKSYFVMLRSI